MVLAPANCSLNIFVLTVLRVKFKHLDNTLILLVEDLAVITVIRIVTSGDRYLEFIQVSDKTPSAHRIGG